MAKSKTELLTEAAAILAKLTQADLEAADLPKFGGIREVLLPHHGLSANALQALAQQWLQEEISEEDGDPSSESQNEEPPTDDRWMAVYLKSLGSLLDGVAKVLAEGAALDMTAERLRAFALMSPDMAKTIADAGLAHAKKQAQESTCQPASN
jgi:hypothetical protein